MFRRRLVGGGALIVEDAHVLDTDGLQRLGALCDDIVPAWRMIVTGRSVGIQFTGERRLSGADLAFTIDDTAVLLGDEALAASVTHEFSGWPAAIALSVAMPARTTSASASTSTSTRFAALVDGLLAGLDDRAAALLGHLPVVSDSIGSAVGIAHLVDMAISVGLPLRATGSWWRLPDPIREHVQDRAAIAADDLVAALGVVFAAGDTTLAIDMLRLAVYADLIKAIGIQHGETFTLQLEEVRAKFLLDHTPGHEPLLLVHPTGTVRTGYFRPSQSLTQMSDRTDFIKIDGQELNLAKRPGSNGLLDFPEVVEPPTNTFLSPATWKDFGDDVKEVLIDRAGGIYRSLPGRVDQWNPRTREWIINVPIQVNGLLHVSPQTATGAAPKGATELPIVAPGDLGLAPDVPWFEIGDTVVIDPGGPNEQLAVITGFGSLILDRPLAHDILAGTMVAMVAPGVAVAPVTTVTSVDPVVTVEPTVRGQLPATGGESRTTSAWAIAVLGLGFVLTRLRRRCA